MELFSDVSKFNGFNIQVAYLYLTESSASKGYRGATLVSKHSKKKTKNEIANVCFVYLAVFIIYQFILALKYLSKCGNLV